MNTWQEMTGERVLEAAYQTSPGGYLIYLMHIASYRLAEAYCAGKVVLDLGCGTGYGASHIADLAHSVCGVDVSAEAITFARTQYPKSNLHFETITAGARLPFGDQSFDVVLSFQVLEHVQDDARYVAEATRVLRPGGLLILVTPDRQHRLLRAQRPWNRWHVREYGMKELLELIKKDLVVKDAFYMGLKGEGVALEFNRYRFLKWATLPFTFPGAPEGWRRFGLALLHRLRPARSHENFKPAFGPEVIEFSHEVTHPVNLVVIATRPTENIANLHA